jgi:hypothetical protein
MAPEIRLGMKAVFASDIFSFSMTAVQMLTRESPHFDNAEGQVANTFSSVMQSPVKLVKLFQSAASSYPQNRPTSTATAAEVYALLASDLGGDPRNKFAESEDSEITVLMEETARRVAKEQTKKASAKMNTTSTTTPTSHSQCLNNQWWRV